ncbi:hypothetical protein K474DRAFT_1678580 [Panus rudis PR-1116 ss-1]|nr:hypothetical protein K474DRAFT_1678580 [Panus rudis PR-1116 ss-1]
MCPSLFLAFTTLPALYTFLTSSLASVNGIIQSHQQVAMRSKGNKYQATPLLNYIPLSQDSPAIAPPMSITRTRLLDETMCTLHIQMTLVSIRANTIPPFLYPTGHAYNEVNNHTGIVEGHFMVRRLMEWRVSLSDTFKALGLSTSAPIVSMGFSPWSALNVREPQSWNHREADHRLTARSAAW